MTEEKNDGDNLIETTSKDPVQDLKRFDDTAVAFDDMIVQVGRGIARAQEMMDLSQVAFQRKAVLAFKEGRMKRLDLNPSNAYAIPETKLEIKVGMSMSYPEGGGEAALSAVPLNASSTNESDIDVEAATEIKLKFVSVPSTKEPPPPSSALTRDEAIALAADDGRVKDILAAGDNYTLMTDYAEDARLWRISWLKAREPEIVLLIDDIKGRVLEVMYLISTPSPEEISPVGEPVLTMASPSEGKRSEVLTIHGDNFLALSGQTILTIEGRPVPLVAHSMGEVSFKVPSWAVRGDVEVITPFGRTGEKGRGLFTPLPTFRAFEPLRGRFDTYRMKGTKLTIYGDNLRPGCNIRFATGAMGRNVEVISPGVMEIEVPEDAGVGPLTLTCDEYEASLLHPFIMLHSIEGFSPRQARIGQEVTVTGSRLGGVDEIDIGGALIPAKTFSFRGATQIRFHVPADARDGRIILRERSAGELIETKSRDIFHVVPRITGFGNSIVSRGEFLKVMGEGLDSDPQMMTIVFEGKRGISLAKVIAVSGDRKSLTVRVPDDCVSGFVRLIRKRVYSGFAAEDTSSLSRNKLTVLKEDGLPSDVLIEERFDSDLSSWLIKAGNWKIEEGALASEGTSELTCALDVPGGELYIHADILKAEAFGLSFEPESGLTRRLWVNLAAETLAAETLAAETPKLSWSTLDAKGKQGFIGGAIVPQFSGKNYSVQVKISEGKASVYIDQEELHSIDWTISAKKVSLLGNSSSQRWDNVLILTRDCLGLPDPDYYRFGEIPAPSAFPIASIDSFQPDKGKAGTRVTITGSGFTDVKDFYIGGVKAETESIAGDRAVVSVPVGAVSGPVEAEVREPVEAEVSGGLRVSSGDRRFVLPPVITNLIPTRVLAEGIIHVTGVNLPHIAEEAGVLIFGVEAEVISASPTMLTARVPDVTGTGPVSIRTPDFTAKAPMPLEVARERVLTDLVGDAAKTSWKTGGGVVAFGGREDEGAVSTRESERMEDGNLYSPVLYLHPPSPSSRALRGEYPVMEVPEGRLELRIQAGMLWDAAPTPDDITEVDGVIFEVSFLPSESDEEIILLSRISCVHDGSLESFVIDAGEIAGEKGQLVLSVFPGRNGLRDDTAIVNGKLVQII